MNAKTAATNTSIGKKLALAALIAGSMLTSGSALAQWHHRHGSHVGIGISFGFPIYGYYPYGPYPYYYPPAYYPPVVAVPVDPPVYIEQPQSQAAAPQAQGNWFYCADSKTYYPYVKDCPAGWLRVPAQPSPR